MLASSHCLGELARLGRLNRVAHNLARHANAARPAAARKGK